MEHKCVMKGEEKSRQKFCGQKVDQVLHSMLFSLRFVMEHLVFLGLAVNKK